MKLETADTSQTRSELVETIPALRAFARSLCRNGNEADDLVQETLVKALSNLDKFEPGTRLKAWLFTIMRFSFNTRYRRARREGPGSLANVSDMRSVQPSQEWTVRFGEVARALDSLPDDQRQVVVLTAVLDMSYEEVAEICGCQLGTVKSRLNRARAKLVELLGEGENSH